MEDITITLTSTITGQAESIEVNSKDTTLKSLTELSAALLDLNTNANSSASNSIIRLYKNGQILTNDENLSLNQCGIVHGDLIAVNTVNIVNNRNNSNALDFSSLLSGNAINNSNASASTANINASDFVREWSGMTIEDAIEANPNPDAFVKLVLDNDSLRHGNNLLKQLNFHMPSLAKRLKECNGNLIEAAKAYREMMVKGSISGAMKVSTQLNKEGEMRKRLQSNPHDEEANAYFGDKVRQRQIDEQYRKMMDEYPESMGRVLMLYIESEMNGHKFQAFVDSGAQMTIMSRKFAEKVGLLEVIDKRFEGYAVGVGKGKILGKVHIAELQIKGHVFPCTITVMDDGGLGNKDMDFILGLDMIKRHRCKIDLFSNNLVFTISSGQYIEAPFLHEKDLDESKGGTVGFDAERANAELEMDVDSDLK